MADPKNPLCADVAPLNQSLSAAAQSLEDFASGPVAQNGNAIESTVNRSFKSVENTIARAVLSGKTSMSGLVNAILADFDRIAVRDFISKPIGNIISSLVGSLIPIGGARAAGGPVDGGVPYLVGEKGPELFVPSSNGAITPNAALGAARPQITLNVQARDAQSFLKSEPQIAAMLSRALARGQRNL